MTYGRFDPLAHEYVITRPDTPRPWSNYLGSRLYGGIITNHAGGYSFTRSPAEGRILRHRYNSVPAEQPGRIFYLRDRDTADYWSAAWQPVGKPLDRYRTETRFGPGYASIATAYEGIDTESLYFIPLNQEFEYWRLRVTNTGKIPRRLSVFACAEFTNEWNLVNDLLNLQYTQYIGEASFHDGFIRASSCSRLPEDPGDFTNRDQSRWWWMTLAGGDICGYDCDREAFLGAYRGYDRPLAVKLGSCGNNAGVSDNTCGVLQCDLDLEPSETRELRVLLGIGRSDRAGRATLRRHGSAAACERALTALKARWHGLLESFRVETPDAAFDHMVNTWGAYNALVTFEWSRSCSLVYTGDQRDGFGFRDTVQDMLGVAAMIPHEVRQRLILMLSAQDATGGAQPEVHPWSHTPGKMKPTPAGHYRSDDCLWFFNTIPVYVAETGDTAFYDEIVPFADKGKATVLGHLRRALEFNLARTGRNGLPCGLQADWNDCLKLGYKGESVFVAFQVRLGLVTYAGVAASMGRHRERAWALAELKKIDHAIARICWDGRWFIWAIAEDGSVFGTAKSQEGRIYLNTQCWAILSGFADAKQTKSSLASVRKHLASFYGVAMCAPPFEKTSVNVMRAVLMNPGNKENGGIFSHTQSWAVLAEIMAGNGNQAYAYYRAFMPSAQNDIVDRREIEPFAHCQSTHSRFSPKFGASRVPWLSGTASWAHYTATHHILGLRPDAGGLRIDPCIPREWPGFNARRLFRGCEIHVEIRNPTKANRGISHLLVNGERIEGNLLPLASIKPDTRVIATLGAV
ncbi:MAG: glycosyltransferase 36 [Rariglobus sp.]|jgi:cellobiose phosphorylase|nr:glycosyltransferase 36 [Rariglobus sp.]